MPGSSGHRFKVVNGDGVADFTINAGGVGPLSKVDFIL